MCKSIATCLAEIDGDRTIKWSLRKVMCHRFHVVESTVSRWLEQPYERMEIEQIAELSRVLDDEYDDRRLADCFHGQRSTLRPRHDVFTNGLIHDDVTGMVEATGDVIRHYNAGEKDQARVAHIRGTAHWTNLGEEIERL